MSASLADISGFGSPLLAVLGGCKEPLADPRQVLTPNWHGVRYGLPWLLVKALDDGYWEFSIAYFLPDLYPVSLHLSYP
jgi:hypothetical protein